MKNKIIISMNIVGVIPNVSLMFCTRSDSQLTIVGLGLWLELVSQRSGRSVIRLLICLAILPFKPLTK